jgi:hypothetical protein
MIKLQQGMIKKTELLGVLKPVYESVIIPFTKEEIEKEKAREKEFDRTRRESTSSCCIPMFFSQLPKLEYKFIVKVFCLNNQCFSQIFDKEEEAEKYYKKISKILKGEKK